MIGSLRRQAQPSQERSVSALVSPTYPCGILPVLRLLDVGRHSIDMLDPWALVVTIEVGVGLQRLSEVVDESVRSVGVVRDVVSRPESGIVALFDVDVWCLA